MVLGNFIHMLYRSSTLNLRAKIQHLHLAGELPLCEHTTLVCGLSSTTLALLAFHPGVVSCTLVYRNLVIVDTVLLKHSLHFNLTIMT